MDYINIRIFELYHNYYSISVITLYPQLLQNKNDNKIDISLNIFIYFVFNTPSLLSEPFAAAGLSYLSIRISSRVLSIYARGSLVV